MRQHALTILTPIDADKVDALDAFLSELGLNVAKQTLIPFAQLDRLHFASWVIIRNPESEPQLVFESNFDGPAEGFIRQLTETARDALNEIYRYCPGYPAAGSASDVRKYLLRHAVYTDTFYVGCVGFSLPRIRAEADLRDRIEQFLDTQPLAELDAAEIRRRIQDFVRTEPALQWAKNPPEGDTLYEKIQLWAPVVIVAAAVLYGLFSLFEASSWTGLLALAGALLVTFVVLYVILRRKEEADVPDDQPADLEQLRKLVSREDFRVQNHLTSLTVVKPGLFRYLLLRGVLAVVNVVARYFATKGELAGIPSIHFARWAVINGGKQLIFLSNFDGSWEHYLGEFIDRASNGLTAVWSNAVGFPRTRGLIHGGARYEQQFKNYARKSQAYTQLWYSAYPFLSVSNILNNAAIREKLWGALEGEALQAWLRRF